MMASRETMLRLHPNPFLTRRARAAARRSPEKGAGTVFVHRFLRPGHPDVTARPPLRPWPALLAAALLISSQAGCGPVQKTPGLDDVATFRCTDCNVILISIDTLRADHLGTYGYRRNTSPNIDRLARESVLFDRNINTGGGTLPVHVSMFTSLPPTVHGIWPDSGRALDSARVTLADQMRAAGYHTRGYTGGGFVRAKYGLGQGFDYFYDSGGNFATELPLLNQWLDTYHGGKFFLFLHTYDVHSGFDKLPYDHGAAWNRLYTANYGGSFDGCKEGLCASALLSRINREVVAKRLRATDVFSAADIAYMMGLYDGGISYVDDALGRLFEGLKARGLWDKTVLVFTADHGEEFTEHRLFLHDQNYEEIARVPLIIHFPRGAFGGRRISEMVSTLEIMPTILDAVGIPSNPEVEGESLLPLIASGAEGLAQVYMAGALEKLRTPGWSLLALETGPAQLFDLRQDPGETTNLIYQRPQMARALFAQYLAARRHELRLARQLLLARPDSMITLTPEEKAHLRSLGYAQ
jgi:arylsulfatase A-like enzyme